MNNLSKTVWIFHGANARFSSGVFSSSQNAKDWISANKLSGILTEYPLDEGVYDWAIKNNYFAVAKENHLEPSFIAKFSSASQQHFHFEDGEKESEE